MSRSAFVRTALASVGALFTAAALHAFALLGPIWLDGNIEMQLQLGTPTAALTDGAKDWGAVAESIMAEWNAQLTRAKFTFVRDSTAAIAEGNRLNNVAFRPTIYGEAWGSGVLAVTLGGTSATTGAPTDRDVLFNSNLQWDSYRGPLHTSANASTNVYDFRRVALHEFGHVLGLDHPDETGDFPDARATQSVSAIMRSHISSGTETLQADDITGVKLLYDALPAGASAQTGAVEAGSGSFTLSAPAVGSGTWNYFYYFRPTGSTAVEEFSFARESSYTIGSVQPADSGTFIITATNTATGAFLSRSSTLSVVPATTLPDTTLGNLSTRGTVGAGNSVLIAGFVIGGTTPKPVLVRAVGPALRDFGVDGALGDPTLSIVNAQNQTVAQNDNWETGGSASVISAASTRLGAFQFKTGSLDSALLVTLPPGSYSAVVSGVNNATGVALAEVYDADPDAATARTHRLVNIATRGQVGGGENDLIAGLVVSGPGPRTYLVRAVGPTLARAPFNVTGALVDPVLQVYRGTTLIHENDDIDSPLTQLAVLRDAAKQVGAFTLTETRSRQGGLDSAMILTLQPGAYTAKVSGLGGLKGVALIEIYEMP